MLGNIESDLSAGREVKEAVGFQIWIWNPWRCRPETQRHELEGIINLSTLFYSWFSSPEQLTGVEGEGSRWDIRLEGLSTIISGANTIIYLQDNSSSCMVYVFGILPLLALPFQITFLRLLQTLLFQTESPDATGEPASSCRWPTEHSETPGFGLKWETVGKGRHNVLSPDSCGCRAQVYSCHIARKALAAHQAKAQTTLYFPTLSRRHFAGLLYRRVSVCPALPGMAWTGVFYSSIIITVCPFTFKIPPAWGVNYTIIHLKACFFDTFYTNSPS